MQIQLGSTDAKRYFLLFDNAGGFCRYQSDSEIIDERDADAVGPPKLRIFDMNIIVGVFLPCWEGRYLIIIKNDLKLIVSFKLFHLPFKRDSKINSSSFFTNRSCSNPDIVDLYLVVGL